MSNAKAIWENLTEHEIEDREIEARTHTRNVKQNGDWVEEEYHLYYYSWSACWRELMNRYPDAQYTFCSFEREGKLYDVMYYADSTASVHCQVTIDGITREMWLPVMDYKNKAIPNPDARAISDTKMRCLVKTVAMFGLGLDLYEGKYVPPEHRVVTGDADIDEDDQTQSWEFDICDNAGVSFAMFTDAKSWIAAMEEQPIDVRDNQHNQSTGQKVIEYVLGHPNLTDKTKTNTVSKIKNLFSQE